jgi:hypothetical protein
MAYASGTFAVNGDAQASLYVLRTTTINTVQTELTIDVPPNITGGQMNMPINSVWAFDILVVASSDTGLSAGYQIKGVARRAANGIVTLLPGVISTTCAVVRLH